jgi:hypothetical protein
MNVASRSAADVIRSCLSNLSERELNAASRAAGVPREAIVAFLDHRGGISNQALQRLSLQVWQGSRTFTGYLDELKPSARRRLDLPSARARR